MFSALLLGFAAFNVVRSSEFENNTSGLIHFSPELIPLVTEPLPAFDLGEAVVASTDLISSIIRNVAPDLELQTSDDCKISAAYLDETLIGFIDPHTGESGVFPLLESLPSGNFNESSQTLDKISADRSIFPLASFEQLVSLPP